MTRQLRRLRARRGLPPARPSLLSILWSVLFIAPAQLAVRRFSHLRVRLFAGTIHVRDYATAGLGTEASPWTNWEGAIDPTKTTRYYFEPGHYKTNTTIEISALKGVILQGGGIDSTVIWFTGGTHGIFVGADVNGPQMQNALISDLTVRAHVTRASGGSAVHLEHVGYSTVERVKTNNEPGGTNLWDFGIKVRKSYACGIYDCVTFGYGGDGISTGAGVFLAGDRIGQNDANNISIRNLRAIRGGIAIAGIWIRSCGYGSVTDCDLESSGSAQNILLEAARVFYITGTDCEEAGTPVTVAHVVTKANAFGEKTQKCIIQGGQYAYCTGERLVKLVDAEGCHVGPIYVPSQVMHVVEVGAGCRANRLHFDGTEALKPGGSLVLGATHENGTTWTDEFRQYGWRGLHLDFLGRLGLDWGGDANRETLDIIVPNAAGTSSERMMRFRRNANPQLANARGLDFNADDGTNPPNVRVDSDGVRFGPGGGGALNTLLKYLSAGRLGIGDETILLASDKGAANGVCELDGAERVPVARLPAATTEARGTVLRAAPLVAPAAGALAGGSGVAADGTIEAVAAAGQAPAGVDTVDISNVPKRDDVNVAFALLNRNVADLQDKINKLNARLEDHITKSQEAGQ